MTTETTRKMAAPVHQVHNPALTGAHGGAITTVDERGRPQRFLSSGITPDVHRQMAERGEGQRLFEHLRDLPGPLRVRDLPGYVRSLGFGAAVLPCKTLQGTPIRHRDVDVGSLFLTEKEGGREFTGEDEEVLVLFASLAAAAIANARAYRDEQRARASLEALVGAHRHGHTVGLAGTLGGWGAGGPGQEHVPERRWPAHGPRRPSAGPSPRNGGPAAHRSGPEQPLLQCGQARSGVVAHPGRRVARWRSRRDLDLRPRPWHSTGPAPAPVPEVGKHR